MVHGNKDDFEKVNYPTVSMPFDDCDKVRQVFIFDENRYLLHSENEKISLDDFSSKLSNLSLSEKRFVINYKESGFKTLLLGNLVAFKQENEIKQLLSLDDIVT